MKVSTLFDFIDCYKNLITNVKNLESEMKGPKAKTWDQCTNNSNTQLVTIFNNILSYNIADQAIIGGSKADGDGCWQFAYWSKWAPYLAKSGAKLVESVAEASGADTSDWGTEDFFEKMLV